jgi:hypothetical protein
MAEATGRPTNNIVNDDFMQRDWAHPVPADHAAQEEGHTENNIQNRSPSHSPAEHHLSQGM